MLFHRFFEITKRMFYVYRLLVLCIFLSLIFNLAQEDKRNNNLLATLRNTNLFKYFSNSTYVVTSFRIVVLTWKRSKSLSRLLDSLQHTSYVWPGSPVIPIYLDIHIDGGGEGTSKNNTILVAQEFNCTFGIKTVVIHQQNKGLMKSWLNSCLSSPLGEYCLIAEDDIELSPHWFRFLVNMWTAFHSRTDLAGMTLQKQSFQMKWTGPVKGGGKQNISDPNAVFFYKLVGSWGFSPHPTRWMNFVKEQKNISDPRMKGFINNAWWDGGKGNIWTNYFMWWCEKYDMYNLYFNNVNDDEVICRNWQEPGVHSSGALKSNYPLLQKWNSSWDYNIISQDVNYYSFDIIKVTRIPLFNKTVYYN